MVAEVLEQIQVGMVPEHDDHRPLHLLDPGGYEGHYIIKVSTELELIEITYFLPKGRRFGLKLTLLKALKNSSHGTKS